MNKLKIRRYKPSDNQTVWQLHRLGLAEIGINPSPNSFFERDLNDIENIYLREGDFLVGEFEGRVVAIGAFKRIDENTAELKRMRVHPDFQRRGFGQAIIEELEKRAKEMGYKKMILDTSEEWTKAQNFYQKNGYQEVGRKVLSIRYHAIFYEKDLL